MALRDLGGWLLDVPGFRKRADSVVVESYAVDKGHVVPVGGPTPTGVTPGSFAPGDVTPAGGVSDASRLPSAPPVILEDPR